MDPIFFDSWNVLLRTVVVAVMAYISVVVILRISGRRTLSKMNAFDLVITVSLGSTLATALLNQNVTLAQAAVAFAMLVGMQFIVTWLSVRVPWVRKAVTGEPALLLYQGRILPVALRQVRVTRDEVLAAIRAEGLAAIDEVQAVVLETDGSFSVVHSHSGHGDSSLAGVRKPK